jgi:hypothetical protein
MQTNLMPKPVRRLIVMATTVLLAGGAASLYGNERPAAPEGGLVAVRSTDPSLKLGRSPLAQASGAKKTPAPAAKTPVRGSSFSDPTPRRAATPSPSSASASPRSAAASAVAASVAAARSAGATPIATPMPLSPAPAGGNGFTGLGWDTLANYKYREPLPTEGSKPQDNAARRPKNQIPPTVMAWDKQKVEVEGWMVPMEVDDNGMIKSFVLVRTQPECCFGDTQGMNEWIEVKMDTRLRTDFVIDRPIRVRGVIEVGELIEDGFVLSLYRMTASEVLS